MSVRSIPLSQTLNDYTESVELDGVFYFLRFRWNVRAECWFLDIADSNQVVLRYGIRCIVDGRLIGQSKHIAGMLPGELIGFDTTHRSLDPALADFGTRVLLLYLEAVEFA